MTKGLQIVKEVNFIEYCRKEHVCTFCATPIIKGSSYFTFGKYIKDGNNVRTYLDKSPFKCCFQCYPDKHPKFRQENTTVQLTLGVL